MARDKRDMKVVVEAERDETLGDVIRRARLALKPFRKDENISLTVKFKKKKDSD